MNRWYAKNLNEHCKREGVFLRTLASLSDEQIDALGFRKLLNQITNTKAGNLDIKESVVKVLNQANDTLEIAVSGYIYDFTLGNIQLKVEEYRKENGESPKNILVRINSGGGSAFAGMAIYNYFNTYDGKVTTVIDGLAASAAASIFMSGEERLIHDNMITFMIHRAMSYIDIFEFGNATYLKTVDVQKEKDQVLQLLGVLDDDIIEMYTEKTEMNKSKVIDFMDREYFFNKTEMTKFGIATGIYKKDKDEENKSQSTDQVGENIKSEDDPKQETRPKGDTPSNNHSDLIADCLLFVQ